MTISDEHRRDVERALAQAAPPLWRQLEIKAQAVRLARRSLDLQGDDLYRSLASERELLELSMRAERGEDVDIPSDIEYRTTTARSRRRRPRERPLSVRVAGDGELRQLYGNWAVYDDPVEINDPTQGRFTEVLRHGAAADAIGQKRPPPYLLGHGRHAVVSKTPIGKIDFLGESSGGAWLEATPLQTAMVRDHVIEPARLNLLGHSFAFSAPGPQDETWRRTPGGLPVREVHRMKVFEISATPNPAYENTTLSYRDSAHPELHHPEPRRPLRPWSDEAEAREQYLYLVREGIK